MKIFPLPKNIYYLLSFFTLVLLFSGCSSVRVSQDYDTGFTFKTTGTYSWFEEKLNTAENLQNKNELLSRRFNNSIEQALADKGFTTSSSPDYLVSYQFSVSSRIESEPFDPGVSVVYGRYGRYGGVGVNTGNRIRQYDIGKLQIQIYDATSKQLVWQGTGTREIFQHSTPEEITKKVEEIVQSILEQFPPR